MPINQNNVFGGNHLNVYNSLPNRELDKKAKADILEFIKEKNTTKVVVTVILGDSEASQYADQAISFLKENSFSVERLTALSRLQFSDGSTVYGQGIKRSESNDEIVELIISHRKLKD